MAQKFDKPPKLPSTDSKSAFASKKGSPGAKPGEGTKIASSKSIEGAKTKGAKAKSANGDTHTEGSISVKGGVISENKNQDSSPLSSKDRQKLGSLQDSIKTIASQLPDQMKSHSSQEIPSSDRSSMRSSVKESIELDETASSSSHTGPSQTISNGGVAEQRRRAAPARRRFAANDDVPSIGGLIFSLQQRPSKRPFMLAGIGSLIWVILSSALLWNIINPVIEDLNSFTTIIQSKEAFVTLATIFLPIVLFWFLAILIWRAQELRLMSSAMTEVAVRLAEPDKAAEQSVASLGQSVRRQVTAMNDAISRALGRAGELEAMVHNEVAALERSYSENEHRIRKMIEELGRERTALINDSERISASLSGIGAKLTNQIEHQGKQTTELLQKTSNHISNALIQSSDQVNQSMSEKSNAVLTTIKSMNEQIGKDMPAILDRLGNEQIKLGKVVEHANTNLSTLDNSLVQHAGNLNSALTERTQQLEGIFRKHVQTMSKSIDERNQSLDNALENKLQTFDNTLTIHLERIDDTLHQTADKIDNTMAHKTHHLDMAISTRISELDNALIDRTKIIDAAFTERLGALDHALSESSKLLDHQFSTRAEEISQAMDNRSNYIVQTIGAKTQELDQTLISGAKNLQSTTEDVAQKVVATIQNLSSQAELLKDVSQGMQAHVNGLTKQLREQGAFILNATNQLENSHLKIGSKLGHSQEDMKRLVDAIATRTTDLDQVMSSYSNQLQTTLTAAEQKAQQVMEQMHKQSAAQSMIALQEIGKLRDNATQQTDMAITDMRERIGHVSKEINHEISSLSQEISQTQDQLTSQLHAIPEETRKSASFMRRTLQEQLKALDSLSSVASGSHHIDITTPNQIPPIDQITPTLPGQKQDDNDPLAVSGFTGFEPHIAQPDPGNFGKPITPAAEILQPNPAPQPPQQTATIGEPTPPLSAEERDREIDLITQSLKQRLLAESSQTNPTVDNAPPWSMGDLLARASDLEGKTRETSQAGATLEASTDFTATPSPTQLNLEPATGDNGGPAQPNPANPSTPVKQSNPGPTNAMPGNTPAIEPAGAGDTPPPLNIQAIAKLIDPNIVVQLWQMQKAQIKATIGGEIYRDQGATYNQIHGLYQSNPTFRGNVDRYLMDFERNLLEAERIDPNASKQGSKLNQLLSSETGRVYMLLMHASGRLS